MSPGRERWGGSSLSQCQTATPARPFVVPPAGFVHWDHQERRLSLAGLARLTAGTLGLAAAQGPSLGAGAWVWGGGKPPVPGPSIEASPYRNAICS